MTRRKDGGFEVMASLPWPVGVVLGVVAYVAIRHGLEWYFQSQEGNFSAGLANALSQGLQTPFAWLALFASWLAALLSFIASRKRRALLETQRGLDTLQALSWKEFEMLVGEAFRRQGYAVSETGLGGADGGVDLILRRDGKSTLVQCKQWKQRRIDVRTVREMYGLLTHHNADAIKIVAVGDYTPDALRFAKGKPIELLTGEGLLAHVRSAQSLANPSSTLEAAAPGDIASMPLCPTCQSTMVRRQNRHTRQAFMGCSRFPECKGTRPA